MKAQLVRLGWIGRAVAVALLAGAVRAQEDDSEHPGAAKTKETELERETRYATGLLDLGLPDFAASVMADVEKRWPEAKAVAARLRVDSFASQGKFEQAEVELAKIPSNTVEYMSGRLLISDRYYQYNKLPNARQGYDAVMGAYAKNGPPPEMRKFYKDSAYKYSQMLLNRGDPRGAIKAMRYILLAKPDEYEKRLVSCEMAELLLKVAETLTTAAERQRVLKEAKDLCNDVMWEQDLLFGRAIVVLAHATKMEENSVKARKLVMDRLPMLEQMEQAIADSVRESVRETKPAPTPEAVNNMIRDALRESPMSQCKYLLGILHEEEGRDLLKADKEKEAKGPLGEALGNYFTVVQKYPFSTWAPEACQHIETILATGKERGWNIEIPSGVNMNVVLATRFKDADARFADGNYSDAIRYYLQALNVAPNQPEAIPAIGKLAQSYIHDSNEMYARATIGHLVERYYRNPEKMPVAGNALLGVAQTYLDEGQGPRSREILVLFTEKFPDHDQAPVMLMRIGDAALRVTNYVEAAPMYTKVVEKYNRPGKIYNDALNRLAICQVNLNEYSNAVATLKTLFGLLPDSGEKLATLVRIGDAYRKLENWELAATTYKTVLEMLDKPNNPYSPNAEDRERNKKNRENALFFRGYCYSRMKPETPEEISRYQVLAIEGFEAFLKEYPDSELAPSVLSNIGTLYFIQNQTDKANKAFETLDKKYPNKSSGILYVQFSSLMDLGRFDKAADVAGRMVEEGIRKYTAGQFLAAGNRLLEEGKQAAVAQKAFEIARGAYDPVKDKFPWQQASIGLGKALVASGQAAAAAAPAQEVLTKYSRSPYSADAYQVLYRAFLAQAEAERAPAARTNLYTQAKKRLAFYRSYLKESGAIAEADLDLAKIEVALGEKKKALAVYERLCDQKPVDLRTRECMDTAFETMIPMYLEQKRHRAALDAIDAYIRAFPQGKKLVDARTWRSQLPYELLKQADEEAAVAPPVSATPVLPVATTAAPPAAAESETPPPATPTEPAPPAAPAP